jgi:hypothetical protein
MSGDSGLENRRNAVKLLTMTILFRDLEDQVKAERADNLETKNEALKADLEAIRLENRELASKLKLASK